MESLSISEIYDLVYTTRDKLPNMEFAAPQKYQRYVGLEQLMKNEVQKKGGKSVKDNIVLEETGATQHNNIYDTRQLALVDRQKQITTNWVHADSYWFINRIEDSINADPEAFVSLVESRREDCQMDFANTLEEYIWNTVASSDSTVTPRGLFYWITIGADGETGFFGGQTRDRDGNAITSVGGVTPTDLDRFCNWYSDYDGPTNSEDMVDKMDECFMDVNFISPKFVQDIANDTPLSKQAIYMNKDCFRAYRKYARKSNDQIGPDVGSFAGSPAFSRVPITYVPRLNSVSSDYAGTNPILFVNWNDIQPMVLAGEYFRETTMKPDNAQHNVIVTWVDLMYNFKCRNRRTQGLISTL